MLLYVVSIDICRNHLSFFKGKGAYAWGCNQIVTCRVLRYPSVFLIL
jgi:hypothetical protein